MLSAKTIFGGISSQYIMAPTYAIVSGTATAALMWLLGYGVSFVPTGIMAAIAGGLGAAQSFSIYDKNESSESFRKGRHEAERLLGYAVFAAGVYMLAAYSPALETLNLPRPFEV